MKKNILVSFLCLLGVALVILSAAVMFYKKPVVLSKVSDSQIISMLKKSSDAREYMNGHPDFIIQDKKVLTKDLITAGQNGQSFREVYQGLALENNRYMKVDLISGGGNTGLVSIIDFKKNTVPVAYELLLLSSPSK